MANAVYPKWKEALMNGSANAALTGTVKVALVDTGTYTYSATHEFLTSLTGRVGTDQTLGTKTYTDGAFDAADSTWPSVTGASAEAVVVYVDTGTAATSRLVCYLDTGITGLPVTPNSGNINAVWAATGLFAL